MMLTQTLIAYSRLFLPKIDKTALRIFLESSPKYPSLLSVVQTLQYVGIKMTAGQCDWNYLNNLKSPFLLHLKVKSKDTLVIARKKGERSADSTDGVEVFNPKENSWKTKTEKDFTHLWDGVVIYTDAVPRKRKSVPDGMKVALLASGALILVSGTMFYASEIPILDGLPLTIGILASGIAYLRQNISPIPTIEKLCQLSSTTDCRKVEESTYSSIMGVKMSTLACSFFLAQFVTLLLAGCIGMAHALSTVYLIALLMAIPTGVYSVYSQIKVSKACPLCIIILMCMLAEAVLLLGMEEKIISVSVTLLWISTAAVVGSYLHLLSLWVKARNAELATRIQTHKLKRKKVIIQAESYPVDLLDSPIWFGDENSAVVLTTVISPGCSHCRKVVQTLLSLIEKGYRFRWNIILGKRGDEDSMLVDNWLLCYLTDHKRFFEDLSAWCATGKSIPDYKSESNSEKKSGIGNQSALHWQHTPIENHRIP